MTRSRRRGRSAVQFLDPFPKYLQIREILARRIERTMHVGDRLPTEHQLRAEFGVSRETVRDALSGLEDDGVIMRTPGQGTFVAALPSSNRETRFTGLSEDYTQFKLDTDAAVLFTGEITPETVISESLGVDRGDRVFRIYRRRQFEGRPFSLHEAFFKPDLGRRVAAFDLEVTSIVDVLKRRLKLAVREHHQTIEAIAADTESAGLLDVGIGTPLLQIVRHFRLGADETVVYFRSLYRSDRYYYTVALEQFGGMDVYRGKPDSLPPRQQFRSKDGRARSENLHRSSRLTTPVARARTVKPRQK